MSNKSGRSKNRSKSKKGSQKAGDFSQKRKAAAPRVSTVSDASPKKPAKRPTRETFTPEKKESWKSSLPANSWRGFLPWGMGAAALAIFLVAFALRSHGAFEAKLALARQAVAEKRVVEAERLYRELVEARPDNLGASFELANLLLEKYRREGDPSVLPDAWDLYHSVDYLSGFHAEARLGMAETALALGADDLAAEILAPLAEREPNRPRVRLHLARLLKREKIWPEAAYFLASLARDPQYGAAARDEMDEIERAVFGEIIAWPASGEEPAQATSPVIAN
jgi:tetratricopeptide (TPR) repeat protein